ncbi:formyltransferase [Labrys okinawensis]|uniref:Formyltransferase n=1 Tax=Labrys okinawensis TaxID=346911 RepID=A0A2S9Q8Q5_9HYPH|nr:formyltransferase [Labrys okinawensis]PRH85733.1 formyltransferase [Labrys okinawensis]
MRAWIEGQPVDQHEAIAAAARMLGGARTPIIGGLSGDVAAVRAAYRLAFRIGAAIDCEGSDALYADLGALAARGAMTTTWAEARARADLLLVVGRKAGANPLLDELVAAPVPLAGIAEREVLTLAADRDTLAGHLAVLRALASGRLPPRPETAELNELAGKVKAARFGVAVYDPQELGEPAVGMLQGLVKDLNEETRFSSLPLGVPAAARLALAVGSWTTGDAPRVGLGRGYPEHDPWRFDARRLVASKEADAALWLCAQAHGEVPPAGIPSVVLSGRPDEGQAGIVIEVAVPGEAGTTVCFDERRGTLTAIGSGPSPRNTGAAEILEAIQTAIGEKGPGSC